MIGIKGFEIENQLNVTPSLEDFAEISPMYDCLVFENRKGLQNFSKLRTCKFCQLQYPAKNLSHQMTLKMILQTEFHLRVIVFIFVFNSSTCSFVHQHLGHTFKWLDHGDCATYDHTYLYQIHKICKSWYINLY